MNRPRPVDGQTVGVGCTLLGLYYAVMAVLRYDAAQPEIFAIRALVATYGFVGLRVARRESFAALRAYATVLAFVIGGAGHAVGTLLGHPADHIPLNGLSTFIAIAFLQTAFDVAWVTPTLAGLYAAVLAVASPVHVPLASVVAMLVSSLLAGAITALLHLSLSARLNESLHWWREACERERVALRAKSEFLSTMSHELRSPLHVIIGYADVMADETSPALHGPLDRIRRSALDLLQLVENTMNASRLEAGKLAVFWEDFDPAAVLHDVAAGAGALPEAKRGVPVHWEVPAHLGTAHLDRLKLKEIVQNLVSNALKFTREGAVTVSATTDGTTLHIAVRDTGPGIAPAAQARIFDMFERIDDAHPDRPPGVGLGLYIVRSLVHLLGGTIDLESRPGDGTTFTVHLPMTRAAAPSEEQSAA